ncbi:MAG: YraN family protein [Bacteroidales bacterium]|nr:YraN family protein [Bacteroidales bacterium]
MGKHNDIGREGEFLAQQYLLSHGFAILDTNLRKGKFEVDIVAYREGLIVFVEVKTRSRLDYGNPEEFVDISKQKAYFRMANAYVLEYNRDEEVRFDIISVEMNSEGYNINHIENAFAPWEFRKR